MGLGKLDTHMQKTEAELLPYTIQKNQLKMDQRLKIRAKAVTMYLRRQLNKSFITLDLVMISWM